MDSKKVKEELEKEAKKASGIIKEFKDFISRGNVIDLAVGVVVGGAFGTITTSLVNDVIMPFVGVLIGGFDFSSLAFTVGDARINYGLFIQAVLNFLIIAASIFIVIKFINGIQKAAKSEKMQVEDKSAKKKEDEQLAVLKEIRNELKKSNQK